MSTAECLGLASRCRVLARHAADPQITTLLLRVARDFDDKAAAKIVETISHLPRPR